MAVATSNLSSLKLTLIQGQDSKGEDIKATKTYGYVNSEATDQNVLDVANIIANLQKHDLETITRVDSVSLSE